MKFIVLLAITLAISQAAVSNCNCGATKGLDTTTKDCIDSKVANCESALQADAAKCDLCKADFFPDSDASATTCTAVTTKIADCKYYKADKTCRTCASGKVLGSDNKCAAAITDCVSHSGASTALKCESCKMEMKIKADKSACEAGTKVTNCSTYAPATAPVCVGCETKFYLSSAACTAVTAVTNCASYSGSNGDCTICDAGYVLAAKKCDKITVAKCVAGTAVDKCTFCDGFAPKADFTACDVAVTAVKNCMGYGVDKACFACKAGYGADKDSQCTIKCPTSGTSGTGGDASILKALVLPIVLVIAMLI